MHSDHYLIAYCPRKPSDYFIKPSHQTLFLLSGMLVALNVQRLPLSVTVCVFRDRFDYCKMVGGNRKLEPKEEELCYEKGESLATVELICLREKRR